jgi:hypothetical protein
MDFDAASATLVSDGGFDAASAVPEFDAASAVPEVQGFDAASAKPSNDGVPDGSAVQPKVGAPIPSLPESPDEALLQDDPLKWTWQKVMGSLIPEDVQKSIMDKSGQIAGDVLRNSTILGRVLSHTMGDDLYNQKTASLTRGIEHLAMGFVSPAGIATLGIGAAPVAVQKTLALGFAGSMAKELPDQVKAIGEAKTPEERDQLIVETLGSAAMAALAAKHGFERPAEGGGTPASRGAQIPPPVVPPASVTTDAEGAPVAPLPVDSAAQPATEPASVVPGVEPAPEPSNAATAAAPFHPDALAVNADLAEAPKTAAAIRANPEVFTPSTETPGSQPAVSEAAPSTSPSTVEPATGAVTETPYENKIVAPEQPDQTAGFIDLDTGEVFNNRSTSHAFNQAGNSEPVFNWLSNHANVDKGFITPKGEWLKTDEVKRGGKSAEQIRREELRAKTTGEAQPTVGALPDASVEGEAPQRIAAGAIATRPDLMQFKRMSDTSTGASEQHAQTIGGEWNDVFAGNLLLWEPKNPADYGLSDGQKYIVADGHGRFIKGGEQGVKAYNAQVLREADGISPQDARVIAAEKNIVQGSGTIYDQARFLRNYAATRGQDEALARGRRNGIAGRQAATIGFSASDPVFDSFVNERITPDAAEALARAAPGNEAAQGIGLRELIEQKATPQDAANAVQAALSQAPTAEAEQGDFFANTAMDETWRAMGKRATAEQNQIAEDIANIRNRTRAPEIARRLGVDPNDPAAVTAKIAELKKEQARWKEYAKHSDLLARARGETPSADLPKLREGKSSDELLQGDNDPFNLVSETATDKAARLQREAADQKALADKESKAAREKQDREQGTFEELSQGRQRVADAFERAQSGDEAAFDEMDASFRSRNPPRSESTDEELQSAQKVFTPGAFARLFDVAFEAKDFDAILEAMKVSDKGVWKPLLKKFFAEQADSPEAAAKADWMRHVFNGTRPPDAKAPKSTPPPQPRYAPPPKPGTSTAPPPKSGTAPPPKPPPPAPPPRIPVNPIPGGGAKSPFKIIEDFSKAIGKALQTRRLKPSQLGVYRPGSTMTAVRFASDLDTAAHELAGHWTDDKYGIGKPWMAPRAKSPYDAELATFWAHGSPSKILRIKRAEGIAEFVRAYVMDPAAAKAQAPTFSAYFEKTIPKPAMDALNKFSDDVRRWAGENPLRRASLNIRMEPPTIRERLTEAIIGDSREFSKSPVDTLRAWFDDSYHYAVKGWETALKMQGKTPADIKPSQNFDIMLRLLSSHDARLSDQLEHGLIPLDPTQTVNVKGELDVSRINDPVSGKPMNLEWLLEPFDNSSKAAQETDMRETSAMMVAQRTLEKASIIDQKAKDEIAALDPKDPTTPAKTRRILSAAEADKQNISGIGAGMMQDVEAARQAMADLGRDPNKARRLLESARRYRAWADTNMEYLVDAGRLSKEKAALIRSENTQYVDMHRLSEEFDLQSRIERGVSAVGTARDVMKRFKGSSLEIENVYKSLLSQTDSIQKEALRNKTMQAFTDSLQSARKLYEGNPVELDRIGSVATPQDRNTVAVWQNGEPIHWKLDSDIYEAVKGMGDLGSHAFVDLLAMPQTLARYLITHSPAFMVRNPIRDTMERSVVSAHGSKPWDIFQGYTAADKGRLEAFGGGQFGNYAKDRLTWNRELKRGMKVLRKDPRNILLTPLELKSAWEKLAASTEVIGRVAEFRRAYKDATEHMGYSPDEAALYAASEARGLMDFAKMGSVMRTVNRMVPFSNAHLRGLARGVRSGIDNPGTFAARFSLYVVAPTLAAMAWNHNADSETKKEYLQLPAWQRDFFWNFKIGNHWLRIPKPHELGVMASGVERAIDRMLGNKQALEGFGSSVTSAALPMSSPVEATGPLKVPIEIMFNRDTFRNRDIIPPWERDLKLPLRKGVVHSSATGQAIGHIIGADPRYVDHFLKSYGGLGQGIVDFTSKQQRLGESTVKATGLSANPPSTQSMDYQWVSDWARENGKSGASEIKQLHALVEPVYAAKTAAQADAAARELRQKATEMRAEIQAGEGPAKEKPKKPERPVRIGRHH